MSTTALSFYAPRPAVYVDRPPVDNDSSLDCIIAAVMVVVVALFALISALFAEGPETRNVDPVATAAAQPYRLNIVKRGYVPRDPALPTEALSEVSMEVVVEEFDRLCPLKALPRTATQQQRERIREDNTQIRRTRDALRDYITFIRNGVNRSNPSVYFLNTQKYWLNIAYELRRPAPTSGGEARINPVAVQQKRIDTLYGLAEPMIDHNCEPRKYTQPKRQFERLTGRFDDIGEQFGMWLKAFKEDIVTTRFMNRQFHVLNRARLLAPEWGLGGDEVEQTDPHMTGRCGGEFSREELCAELEANYTPARMISVIKTRLHDEDLGDFVNPYLQRHADNLPDDWETTFFEPHPTAFTERDPVQTLSHQGVAWFLYHTGYLNTGYLNQV